MIALVMHNQLVGPVTTMLDMLGDETKDPEFAISVVVLLPDGRSVATECKRWEIVDMKVN
jgi:hypothetical protein